MLSEATYAAVRNDIANALLALDAEKEEAEGRTKVVVDAAITQLEGVAQQLIGHQAGPRNDEDPRDAGESLTTTDDETLDSVYVLTSETYAPEHGPVVGVFATKADAEAYKTGAEPPVTDGEIEEWAVGADAEADNAMDTEGDGTTGDPADDEGSEADTEADLDAMTVAELEGFAKAHDIELPDANKAEKLAAIKAALAEQDDAGEAEELTEKVDGSEDA